MRPWLAVICASLLWAGRPGNFQVIGPGGGGAMFNPTISLYDERNVLVSCDMTGSYITHDGGKSWKLFNLHGPVRFFAWDPGDPKTVYAETTGLWRSTDAGETWHLLYPDPSAIRAARMNSDHAEEKFDAQSDPLGEITAFAIDPTNSQILYAASSLGHGAYLSVSHDAGRNWERQRELIEPAISLWSIPGGSLLIGMRHSVEVSGRKLSAPSASEFTSITAGVDSHQQVTIYAASTNGVYVSENGAAWRKCTLPGAGAQVRAIATSLHSPQTGYFSYQDLEMDGARWSGVAKTTDSGRTWALVWKESESAAANVHDAWITERFGPGWAENPLMLAVGPNNPNLCYGTDMGRTMKTTDGGKNWFASYSRKMTGGAWTTTGLDVTTNYGVHFDPFDRQRLFITYTDIGLFRSEDGGASWMSSTHGVPRQWLNTTYWVEFDPQVRGRMWSANSYTHDLPRPKMWRHAQVANYQGGICTSDDGGKTWRISNSGMEETAPTHIVLDPKSPANARVLFVAAFGRGVYKSSDGGRTWALKNHGIAQKEPFVWRLARASGGMLYVVLARRTDDGSIGNDGDGAIYRSFDGAENWMRIQLPKGVNGPNGLAIDPQNEQRLYLAAWARASGVHGEGGGIFISENGGRDWRRVLDRDQHVYDVTIDAQRPNIVYAAGFESSAWRSADHGEHWMRIPGFDFKWGHRVIPDPRDPNLVYITTFGGSVWKGAIQ